MSAHDIDNAEGFDGSSFIASAHSKSGAQKKSVRIFFKVRAPLAEKVFLVGDFNGWNESCPMVRDLSGNWSIGLRKKGISDGDAYKFKVYVKDHVLYLSDPYAYETDGGPYHNSVYRDPASRSSGIYESEKHVGINASSPCMVYSVKANKWLRDGGGYVFDLGMLGRELIPYVLQMGYTHVSISGFADEYYDVGTSCHTKAYFAPRGGRSGADGLRKLVHDLHALDIGVLFELDLNKTFGDELTDIGFYTQNALYWLDVYGVDGFVIKDTSLRDREFFSVLVHNIKTEKKECMIVTASNCDEDIRGVTCLGNADRYLPSFKVTGDAVKYLCAKASAMTLLLFEKCGMITKMGEETAQIKDVGEAFDREVGGSYANARFQLFCSKLNNTCIAHYREMDNLISLSFETVGDVRIMKREHSDRELIVAADISGCGAEVTVEGDEWNVILDSCGVLEMWGGATLCKKSGVSVLGLPPYGSAVLSREK